MTPKFYNGQIVGDRNRTVPTDALLVVVDADNGPLRSLTGPAYGAVKENDTNTDLYGGPVPDDEQTVTAAYISAAKNDPPSVGDKTYTFPVDRLQSINANEGDALDGYYPYQWAVSSFLGELVKALDTKQITVESVEDLQVLCMQANIDGEVINHATDVGLGRRNGATTK
jgi:hypothetical protein